MAKTILTWGGVGMTLGSLFVISTGSRGWYSAIALTAGITIFFVGLYVGDRAHGSR